MEHGRRNIIAGGIVIFCVLISGCGEHLLKISVQGSVHGHMLNTTVDSEIARYYLKDYLADRKTNGQLDRQIEAALKSVKDMP